MKLLPKLAFVFMCGCLISCNKGGPGKKSNILQVALSSKISTLDHANSYDTVSAQVVYQIHEALYEYEYLIRPYTLKPLLAQDMPQISKDGKTYTIKIKKGVYYHPHDTFSGKRELKAQDFVNQIKRIAYLPTQSKGWWLFDGRVLGLDEFRKNAKNLSDFQKMKVAGLKALDEHTLQIKLEKPYPQLVYALAMSFTAPSPMELIQKYDNDLSSHPVGTGPFIFHKWDKNLAVELKANTDYRAETFPNSGDRYAYQNKLLKDAGKKIPFVDGIKFHVLREAGPRMQNFLKGNIDFVTLTKDYFNMALNYQGELSKELKKEKIGLQVVPTLTYWWVAFNMDDKLIGKNLKLRQAIAHAIDRERLIKLFTNNIAQKANSIYPPGIPGYDPTTELPYDYDVKKAKRLLAQAGYPEGKGLPTLKYDIRGSSALSRQMGGFVKNELAKIGIDIEIVVNTFPGFLQKAQSGRLQMWRGGWTLDYPEGQNVIQLLASKNFPPGPNTSYYSNPIVNKIYEQASTSLKPGETGQAMKEVEALVNKDLPWVMLYYSRDYVLYHSRVKNFRQSDIIFNYLKYIRLD